MTTQPFVYPVQRVTSTTDGDTWKMTVLTTPDTDWAITCRLSGYDAPETHHVKCSTCGLYTSTFELAQAMAAMVWTRQFITGPGDLWCQLLGIDDFGRRLTDAWHEIDGIQTSLGESLVDQQLASVWPQRWHEAYDPKRDKK